MLTVNTTEESHDGAKRKTNKPRESNEAGSDSPPIPWKTSSTKQRIIDELKDTISDIHLLVGQHTAIDF